MASPAALIRKLRSCCCSPEAAPAGTVRELVEKCLSRGLQEFTPAGVCSLIDALARQTLAHRPLIAASLERMHRGAIVQTPPTALRLWMHALVKMRVPIPAEHFDECLRALAGPARCGSAVTAAPLLRMLLLAGTTPERAALAHGNGVVGRLLSVLAMSGNLGSAAAAGPAGSARATARTCLADVAWLVDQRPPTWWRPLAAHHAAVLEAARSWCGEPAPLPSRTHRVERSARVALERLWCSPEVGAVIGHQRISLALPELRVAFVFPGPCGEVRDVELAEACAGSETFHTRIGTSTSSELPPLQPLLEMRMAQLKTEGWHVVVFRDSEWPMLPEGEDSAALHRREELLLRLKLADVLQARVPRHRRQVVWPE